MKRLLNKRTLIVLLQALLPLLANQASSRLSASACADTEMPTSARYATGRAERVSSTASLPVRLGGCGVRVDAVSPDPVATLI